MRFLAQASTVACFISVVWEARAAIVVRQVTSAGLERRAPDQAFLGGWSLRAMTCPSGHEKCGAAKGMPACCPTGSVCNTDYIRFNDYVACCPKDQGCVSQLYSLPVCADAGWVLWQPWDNKKAEPYGTPFCCLKGQKGYLTTGDRTNPACGDPNVAVGTSMSATTITPAGATAASNGDDANSASPVSAKSSAAGTSSTSTDSSSGFKNDVNNGSSSPPPSPDSSSGSFSGGVIGGIVGGAVLAVIFVGVGLLCVFRMGKRRGSAEASPASATADSDSVAQGYYGHGGLAGADSNGTAPVYMQQQQGYHHRQQHLAPYGESFAKAAAVAEQTELDSVPVHETHAAQYTELPGREKH